MVWAVLTVLISQTWVPLFFVGLHAWYAGCGLDIIIRAGSLLASRPSLEGVTKEHWLSNPSSFFFGPRLPYPPNIMVKHSQTGAFLQALRQGLASIAHLSKVGVGGCRRHPPTLVAQLVQMMDEGIPDVLAVIVADWLSQLFCDLQLCKGRLVVGKRKGLANSLQASVLSR